MRDSNEINRMMMAAARGLSLEEAGVENTPSNREYYAKLIEELNAAPKGVMLSPLNEWPDDTYDELSAASQKRWGGPRTLQQMKDDEE